MSLVLCTPESMHSDNAEPGTLATASKNGVEKEHVLVATQRPPLTGALTEEGYRRLVELSPDGICVYVGGRVVYVNDAAVRLSVGVVEVQSAEQRTADEILREADLAMDEAKRANRRTGG